ncbi:uncharacterized protein C2orf42 homolog isoform X1 [Erpetoichthys calabaricus]|nr:uncharacterized protein C2orf42 homolog isoform X1 [Erpetoichthys calabaricus]
MVTGRTESRRGERVGRNFRYEPGGTEEPEHKMDTSSAVITAATVSALIRDKTKTPSFLSNLGKPTLRGIRKCPKCGMYNGTRGLSCKNKTCGTVFRDGARKPQPCMDAVKILTGSDAQVFSVRHRDRGPEYRGFVELSTTETSIETADGTLITQISSGHCFVSSCGKATRRANPESPCLHMKTAMECQSEATPLTLKSSVLSSLQITPETKQTIWQLATESTGPLVQRISKNVMVVKCKVSDKHLLGYLHVSFSERSKAKEVMELRFQCPCNISKTGKTGSIGLSLVGGLEEGDSAPQQHCIHFYACICAFASDEQLGEEFSGFVNYSTNGLQVKPEAELSFPNAVMLTKSCIPAYSKKVKKEGCITSNHAVSGQEGVNINLRKSTSKKNAFSSVLKRQGSSQTVDESHITLPFHQWLSSVTERIHQTMHFQFDGKPEPLVFHIPQSFFEALQQRISSGSRKKRLPNSTTAFVRKDALPLGTFSKYTWHITNILQVKQIFDTPEMPLEVTQSFIKNRDGTFELFHCPEVQVESITDPYGRVDKQPAIRPLELKTFLKVGNTTPDQKDPTPFVIEWIPDILPQSKIGELRLRFEYGHLHNGHVEYMVQPACAEHTVELCPAVTGISLH